MSARFLGSMPCTGGETSSTIHGVVTGASMTPTAVAVSLGVAVRTIALELNRAFVDVVGSTVFRDKLHRTAHSHGSLSPVSLKQAGDAA